MGFFSTVINRNVNSNQSGRRLHHRYYNHRRHRRCRRCHRYHQCYRRHHRRRRYHHHCRRCYRRGRLPGAVPEEERKVQDQHSGTVIYPLMASRFTAGGHFWIAVCCPHASADGLRRIRGIILFLNKMISSFYSAVSRQTAWAAVRNVLTSFFSGSGRWPQSCGLIKRF